MKEYVCLACGSKVAFHSEFNDFWCPACGAMHISIGLGAWRVARPTNQIFRDIESDPPPKGMEIEYLCPVTGWRGCGVALVLSCGVYDSGTRITKVSWRPINPGAPEEKKNES